MEHKTHFFRPSPRICGECLVVSAESSTAGWIVHSSARTDESREAHLYHSLSDNSSVMERVAGTNWRCKHLASHSSGAERNFPTLTAVTEMWNFLMKCQNWVEKGTVPLPTARFYGQAMRTPGMCVTNGRAVMDKHWQHAAVRTPRMRRIQRQRRQGQALNCTLL